MMYAFYQPTKHLIKRYRQRMSSKLRHKMTKYKILNAHPNELARRANYMLLFSTHGRYGTNKHTEIRYYFEWNIVVCNKNQTIITMYIDERRPIPPVKYFGDRKVRKMIYDLMFRPNSKICKKAYA